MIKITIEEPGREPQIVECQEFILRTDDGDEQVLKGVFNHQFLAASAAYISELSRKEIRKEIDGQ